MVTPTRKTRGANSTQNTDIQIKVPVQLTVKELLMIGGYIVSIVLAWGAFQTKLGVLEQVIVMQQRQLDEMKSEVKEMRNQVEDVRDVVRSTMYQQQSRDLLLPKRTH